MQQRRGDIEDERDGRASGEERWRGAATRACAIACADLVVVLANALSIRPGGLRDASRHLEKRAHAHSAAALLCSIGLKDIPDRLVQRCGHAHRLPTAPEDLVGRRVHGEASVGAAADRGGGGGGTRIKGEWRGVKTKLEDEVEAPAAVDALGLCHQPPGVVKLVPLRTPRVGRPPRRLPRNRRALRRALRRGRWLLRLLRPPRRLRVSVRQILLWLLLTLMVAVVVVVVVVVVVAVVGRAQPSARRGARGARRRHDRHKAGALSKEGRTGQRRGRDEPQRREGVAEEGEWLAQRRALVRLADGEDARGRELSLQLRCGRHVSGRRNAEKAHLQGRPWKAVDGQWKARGRRWKAMEG